VADAQLKFQFNEVVAQYGSLAFMAPQIQR